MNSTSTTIAPRMPKPPGESSPNPLLANPPSWAAASHPSPDEPMSAMTLVAATPPMTCATT
ncbi:hypothetical protein J2S61_002097 [Microbacterium barkeri]|nr:hypothetical protein [Microbacterium barkeri]